MPTRFIRTLLVSLVLLVSFSACAVSSNRSSFKTLGTPTTIPISIATSNATPIALTTSNDPTLEAAARDVIQAMALVSYKDPTTWKNKLLQLSNDDGQKFWQANFDAMLADVIAHKRVAESVKVERVVVLERQQRTDAQGKTISAAAVLVTGRVIYADDIGRHDDPINQPMLLANLDGQWKFVILISPSALMSAPNPTPKR